jgi:hypothetical protein
VTKKECLRVLRAFVVTFLAYYLANDRNSVKEIALPPTTWAVTRKEAKDFCLEAAPTMGSMVRIFPRAQE